MNNDTALILLLADRQREIEGLRQAITDRDQQIEELRAMLLQAQAEAVTVDTWVQKESGEPSASLPTTTAEQLSPSAPSPPLQAPTPSAESGSDQ